MTTPLPYLYIVLRTHSASVFHIWPVLVNITAKFLCVHIIINKLACCCIYHVHYVHPSIHPPTLDHAAMHGESRPVHATTTSGHNGGAANESTGQGGASQEDG